MKNSTIIVADDLTGANDTALQYFKKGYLSKILIDYTCESIQEEQKTDEAIAWAFSTESRNVDKELAFERTSNITRKLKDCFNFDNFYKKIDSTLRGNTGIEIIAMLEALEKDCAIVAPAFIEENRTTIGGYQLLNNFPIERTQVALDPKSPIYESYIIDILKKDLNPKFHDIIGLVDFKIVSKGARPIVLKINELFQAGKKIIVMDAMSKVDLEQIVLAIDKTNLDILPVGSAGLAIAINKHLDDIEKIKPNILNLPKLIISGSATNLTLKQIEKLKETKKDIKAFDLTTEDIIEGINEKMLEDIITFLNEGYDVIVHSSYIKKEIETTNGANSLIDAAIAKDEFPSKITDYLADLTYQINQKSEFNLISIGGETSFKCALKMKSNYLEIIDAILPAIPLCVDCHNQIMVTKSGNFGNQNTLVEILDYFNKDS